MFNDRLQPYQYAHVNPPSAYSRADLASDRAALRTRWRQMGFHTSLTLGEAIAEGARRNPTTQLIFHSYEHPAETTLAELHRRAIHVAAGLRHLGYGAGDVLAVQVPNWIEGVITYQAAMHLGLLIVPIVHVYGPAEVGFILRSSGARGLVVPSTWRNIDFLDRVASLKDVPKLEHVLVIERAGIAGSPETSARTNRLDGSEVVTIPWSSLESGQNHVPISTVSADAPCLLIYTSGTTAEPKGVVHNHASLIAEVNSLTSLLGVGPDRVTLAAFPAGHIAGVLNVLRVSLHGNSVVFMDQWEPAAAAELIEQHRCTNTSGTPFHLIGLMEAAAANQRDIGSMTGYMAGAASVAPSLVERADAFGIRTYRAYGSSEHPVVTTGHPDDPLQDRATTDGRPTPGNELRLVDDDGNDVTPGEAGEIAVRGPEQFVRYQNPLHDDDAFLPGAWFLTGDIGRLNADGYLTITDRKKDVIIRGGENIASKEVEDLLALHPAVLEAAVIGRPDPRYGERVMAFVITRNGETLDLDDVGRHFASLGVARQKTPEFIKVVTELPRGSSGKVKKFELRDRIR